MKQAKLVRLANGENEQPPLYNQSMQAGCSTAVVIPMQSMHPDQIKKKPQAV